MDNKIINDNIKLLNEIIQLYNKYTELINNKSLSNESINNTNTKLQLFNDNLEFIKENMYDLISDINQSYLSSTIKSKIEFSKKTNEICKDFYPLILMRIISDIN